MTARDASIAFARAFCGGDLDRLETLLAPDLRFEGPLFSFDSRAAYLETLRRDPPEPGRCEVISVHGDEREAAILYEYGPAGGGVLVAQFNELTGARIRRIRLIFDTGRLAALP